MEPRPWYYYVHRPSGRCHRGWTDEWSSMWDDDCPHCGARHMSPYDSDDLTEVVEGMFVVRRSPDTGEDGPDYCEIGRFDSAERVEKFMEAGSG